MAIGKGGGGEGLPLGGAGCIEERVPTVGGVALGEQWVGGMGLGEGWAA
jgi:hypothetical protein